MSQTPTVAVDFDGVVHQYVSKWTSATEILDPPVPGAIEWIRRLLGDGFHVVIWSARLTWDDDEEWADVEAAELAIRRWLTDWGLDPDDVEALEYWTAPGKPKALLYVDDRAFRFQGRFPHRGDIYRRPYKTPPNPKKSFGK